MKNWPWYGYLIFAVLIFALAFLFYFKPQNTKLKALTAERVKARDAPSCGMCSTRCCLAG